MATSTWKSGTPGNWTTNGRWDPSGQPGANSDVTISVAGTYIATLSSASAALNSLTINNATATLAITNKGKLNVTGTGLGATDTLTMQAGTVEVVSGGVIAATSIAFGGASGILTGAGSVTGILSGAGGLVTASNGTLDLTSNIAAATGLNYGIGSLGASILKLDGAVGSANTFTLQGTTGDALQLNDVTASSINFKGIASGLINAGTAAPNLGTINYINLQDAAAPITKVTLTTPTTLELFHNAIDLGTITLGAPAAGNFVNWGADSTQTGGTIGSGTDIWLSTVVCYAAGTLILMSDGEKPVEDIAAGDMVMTLVGEAQVPQPVSWIGERRISVAAHPRPELVAPVMIRRGAFGEDLPRRDMLLSPDHCLFVNGKLIPAKLLINDMTIVQRRDVPVVHYFHVELERHAILLAEGLPAESYLDTGNRAYFSNSGLALVLHPEFHVNAGLKSWEEHACAPFAIAPEVVEPEWRVLAARAERLGYIRPAVATTTDAALHLVADGRTIAPVSVSGARHVFVLPAGTNDVRVASRSAIPSDFRGMARRLAPPRRRGEADRDPIRHMRIGHPPGPSGADRRLVPRGTRRHLAMALD